MTVLLYLENNLFAMVILIIIYLSSKRTYCAKNTSDQFLFNSIVMSTFLILIFDSGMWALNGLRFEGARELNILCTVLYFFLNPVPCMAWMCYGDFKMYNDQKGLYKRMPYYCILVLVNVALVLISLKTGWIFSIDENNIYHRGPHIWVIAIIAFVYLIGASILVLVKARRDFKDIPKELYIYFILFPLPPIIGSILQIMYYGLSMIWVGLVISLLFIFINIQNKSLYHDPLTGVYNRKYLQPRTWANITRSIGKHDILFLMLIDIDKFKHTNDTYGHTTGDKALHNLARILADIARNRYTVIRYGGDEFIVTGVCKNQAELDHIPTRIQKHLTQFNNTHQKMYHIEVSIGTTQAQSGEDASMETMIKQADEMMYIQKELNKS